jgi:hypothetical protein
VVHDLALRAYTYTRPVNMTWPHCGWMVQVTLGEDTDPELKKKKQLQQNLSPKEAYLAKKKAAEQEKNNRSPKGNEDKKA